MTLSSLPNKSKILHDYPTRFIACRQGQHRWPPYTTWHWKVTVNLKREPIEYRLDLECEICGKLAHDVIDAKSGEKSRHYTDPRVPKGQQGYHIPSDADVSRTDLRLELLHRTANVAEVVER